MWFKNNKNISARVNSVPPGDNPKMKKKNYETNGHIVHNLYDPGANPQPKNPKKKIPETIEIYVDFQVWGI